ncbi:hypothetical protein [Desulfosporosinus sp. I2]|uniref:hypothetical protein n=1 Tax=Desulfosporosinus sp. I2 TaxID=1617025 RepID=UPI0005EE8D59|nr:hypothetical protein [Desulfosporosinus sp. I2]
MRGSEGRTASYNTVFATLAMMDAVGTRRKYPQRYLKVGGKKRKKIAAGATLVGKLRHGFRLHKAC